MTAPDSLSTLNFSTGAMIASIVVTATAGDVLTASAMRKIGDLDLIRAESGLAGAIRAVVGSPRFLAGVFCMAVSFFALLFALNHADLSLIAPASASLTFVSNAFAAKLFLRENVDRRRVLAAVCVCIGVALLAH
jgi:multidrug transporter EmrE-like cation transporter